MRLGQLEMKITRMVRTRKTDNYLIQKASQPLNHHSYLVGSLCMSEWISGSYWSGDHTTGSSSKMIDLDNEKEVVQWGRGEGGQTKD